MPGPEDRPPATPRQLDPKVLGAALALGVACLLVAVTGGPVTALGFGLPGVESPLVRVINQITAENAELRETLKMPPANVVPLSRRTGSSAESGTPRRTQR
jgi:hypothetical protein